MPKTHLSNVVQREDPCFDDAFRRQQAMADKALFPKYLGKRRGQVWNSFGKILPKVGIYPRHWYSESLKTTRELNVLFLWVAHVNSCQEQGFRKVKFDIASASRRSWYESESGVKSGYEGSSPVPIWI